MDTRAVGSPRNGDGKSGGEPRPARAKTAPVEPSRASRPTMRAYCQHCDRSEQIAPEEIYSTEFDFWCPRCHNILILQDDGTAQPGDENGGAPDDQAAQTPRIREAPTRVDTYSSKVLRKVPR